jgi:bifunctional UDP-N-acetylglucosamine pyrophosphorylase/glucosamine-1-phosphate N-acetyltransferase
MASVGPDCTLRNTTVGEAATVIKSHCTSAEIGARASVGPYSYLRPGTILGAGAKAGAFVELKNATVGDGSKVPHLSYVGDAEIGEGSNIGAATIFVNYDGAEKHATVVGDEVRVGSDTMLVAPVTIGDGAYTAAGSVITEDVPPGAIGIGRSRQRNVEGWVERQRPNSTSAEAARRARESASSGQNVAEQATMDTPSPVDSEHGDGEQGADA